MKKYYPPLLACLLISLLCGCSTDAAQLPEEAVEETVAATVPPDGDPADVTCKGSYTGEGNADVVVAQTEDTALTNGALQVWYWAEVAQYRQSQPEITPDFDLPLDVQPCEIDDSVASWQQYFLKQALNAWHSSQALLRQAEQEGVPTEEAYKPDRSKYETYMDGMPASKVLYGYSESYQPNSMHQAYLDGIPDMLEEMAKDRGLADTAALADIAFGAQESDLLAFAEDHNRSYMYFTTLSYDLEPTGEEISQYRSSHSGDEGRYVDIRHILLVPEGASVAADGTVTCDDDSWTECEAQAAELLEGWLDGDATEAAFGALANEYSQDPGSAPSGGSYSQLREGQLTQVLDRWCFDALRQEGDTAILRSDYGCHIVYFSGSTEIAEIQARDALLAQQQADIITQTRNTYPMEVDYSAITLAQAEGTVSTGDLLYADIAHERFPEVPLYLQQDYPGTMYGNYKITTNGCGITSLAMLASYLTDDDLTPPKMCAMFGSYSGSNGTDGRIFEKEPAGLGFYLIKKTYDWREARDYMEEGHQVIVVQYKGYWTSGGHYLVLETLSEDGLVQVRDSNIYNYVKLRRHKDDLFPWDTINLAGMGYWIFDHKVTTIDACTRCGEREGVAGSIVADYGCEKCAAALLRRGTYLSKH